MVIPRNFGKGINVLSNLCVERKNEWISKWKIDSGQVPSIICGKISFTRIIRTQIVIAGRILKTTHGTVGLDIGMLNVVPDMCSSHIGWNAWMLSFWFNVIFPIHFNYLNIFSHFSGIRPKWTCIRQIYQQNIQIRNDRRTRRPAICRMIKLIWHCQKRNLNYENLINNNKLYLWIYNFL